MLSNGQLGLIDFGQTRRLTNTERRSLARVVAAIGSPDSHAIAETMRGAGFRLSRDDNDEDYVDYAEIFFNSDQGRFALGLATPQLYFGHLMTKNALVEIPDAAIFVARTSFLFRGLGTTMMNEKSFVETARRWRPYAAAAIDQ